MSAAIIASAFTLGLLGASHCVSMCSGFASLTAGLGFGVKIYEFAEDLLADQGIGFAGAHLVTYAFVAIGFLLLLAGTFLRGHYADIEKAKFDMLERELAHDAHDAHARSGRLGHAHRG